MLRRSAGRIAVAVWLAFATAWVMPSTAAPQSPSPREQVWATELAFARTMADRDLKKFSGYIADEAVFFSGTTALIGKAKIVEDWAPLFTAPSAPFSWQPDQVEVLSSGTLAISTGPVRDPTGAVIGRFNTIWRLESGNQWRAVFDKGSPPSPGPSAQDKLPEGQLPSIIR